MAKNVLPIMLDLDFKALKKQKTQLVKMIWNKKNDTLWGLVHLIDFIQDEGEKIFGENVVYPKSKRS